MPKRLDRDQEPKKEGGKDGKKGKEICWTRQQKKMNRTKMKDKTKGESEDDSGDKERKDGQMDREMVRKKNRKRSESL